MQNYLERDMQNYLERAVKGISAVRLEFLPTLDFEVFHTSCGESIDEG